MSKKSHFKKKSEHFALSEFKISDSSIFLSSKTSLLQLTEYLNSLHFKTFGNILNHNSDHIGFSVDSNRMLWYDLIQCAIIIYTSFFPFAIIRKYNSISKRAVQVLRLNSCYCIGSIVQTICFNFTQFVKALLYYARKARTASILLGWIVRFYSIFM